MKKNVSFQLCLKKRCYLKDSKQIFCMRHSLVIDLMDWYSNWFMLNIWPNLFMCKRLTGQLSLCSFSVGLMNESSGNCNCKILFVYSQFLYRAFLREFSTSSFILSTFILYHSLPYFYPLSWFYLYTWVAPHSSMPRTSSWNHYKKKQVLFGWLSYRGCSLYKLEIKIRYKYSSLWCIAW